MRIPANFLSKIINNRNYLEVFVKGETASLDLPVHYHISPLSLVNFQMLKLKLYNFKLLTILIGEIWQSIGRRRKINLHWFSLP
jgi:hypothetical protein